MLVLGIESSCDETGVALYCTERGLMGNALHTQMAMHAEYGGVVPELASRDHIRRLVPLTAACLQEAGADYADIDAVAYTQGPGWAVPCWQVRPMPTAWLSPSAGQCCPCIIWKAICCRRCWRTISPDFPLWRCWCRAGIPS